MIDEMTRPHPGSPRGLTVKQLTHMLEGLPDDMTVVVEGDRLTDPHVIGEVLPAEPFEDVNDKSAAANTVMLSVGGKWKYTETTEAD